MFDTANERSRSELSFAVSNTCSRSPGQKIFLLVRKLSESPNSLVARILATRAQGEGDRTESSRNTAHGEGPDPPEVWVSREVQKHEVDA